MIFLRFSPLVRMAAPAPLVGHRRANVYVSGYCPVFHHGPEAEARAAGLRRQSLNSCFCGELTNVHIQRRTAS
jgi:hypothetical protein